MILLTVQRIILLHTLVIRETGGSDGLRDLGRLEAVVASQNQEVFGEEIYTGITQKAAAIIRGIIADHPFVDGNKRTAMICGIVFMNSNGHIFKAKKRELEDFAVRVATDKLDIPNIAKWLEEHTVQL